MAIISNGTTIASGGSVQGSGANLTNLPSSAPTTSQVLSATKSASASDVGSYATIYLTQSKTPGSTIASGGDCHWGPDEDNFSSSNRPGGTWRVMGRTRSDVNAKRPVVGLRIS